ncbi:putative endopeptidase p60 [bioreactor metagenome]|uniref:Putative endopeptidase p60 n=1 Tax=bioreactor metagenome TaxID=1076179 RepID=A0A645JWV5_9ZZZZ
MTAYAAIGVYLPRVSSQQWGATSRVSVGNAIPGDLIFWSSNGSQSGIYHVAIYLGGGQIIEAADYGIPLRITSIYNWGNVLGAGRVI